LGLECAAMSTIDELLAAARRPLGRVEPGEAFAAIGDGAVLVDIRSDLQRAHDGLLPGAIFIARNVLEWRCDPASPWRDARIADPALRQILICDEGYQSSLAAATLQWLGLERATDVIGGFRAWRDAGLPVEAPPGTLARLRDAA
jgi:rhodanese-related sulfurtransferase